MAMVRMAYSGSVLVLQLNLSPCFPCFQSLSPRSSVQPWVASLSSGNSMVLIGEANVVSGQAQLAWHIPSDFTAGTIATKAIGADGGVWDGRGFSIVKM